MEINMDYLGRSLLHHQLTAVYFGTCFVPFHFDTIDSASQTIQCFKSSHCSSASILTPNLVTTSLDGVKFVHSRPD